MYSIMITTNQSPVSGCIGTNESDPLRSCLMSFQSCTMAGQSFLGRQIWVELQSVFSRADTATKIFENKILKRKIFEKCGAILASPKTDNWLNRPYRTNDHKDYKTNQNRKTIIIWRIKEEFKRNIYNVLPILFNFLMTCQFIFQMNMIWIF